MGYWKDLSCFLGKPQSHGSIKQLSSSSLNGEKEDLSGDEDSVDLELATSSATDALLGNKK